MYFTREDYYNIKQYLINNAIKDTQFDIVQTLNGTEYFPIIQDNTNKIININTFVQDITDSISQSFNDTYATKSDVYKAFNNMSIDYKTSNIDLIFNTVGDTTKKYAINSATNTTSGMLSSEDKAKIDKLIFYPSTSSTLDYSNIPDILVQGYYLTSSAYSAEGKYLTDTSGFYATCLGKGNMQIVGEDSAKDYAKRYNGIYIEYYRVGSTVYYLVLANKYSNNTHLLYLNDNGDLYRYGYNSSSRSNEYLKIVDATIITTVSTLYNQIAAQYFYVDDSDYILNLAGRNSNGALVQNYYTIPKPYTTITYSELKTLRDNGNLIAGRQYRITDYQCTTTQENTSSANHQFDIIVTATSTNTLSEQAKAIKHEGDTYFTSHKETFGNTYGYTDIEINNSGNGASVGSSIYLTNITSYDTIDDAITFMNSNRDSDDQLSDSDITYIKSNAIQYNGKYYVGTIYYDIFGEDTKIFDIEQVEGGYDFDKYVGIYGGTITYDNKTYNSRWIRDDYKSYAFDESLDTLLNTSPHQLTIGSDCNLEAWQLWYTIDNDTNRFTWADNTNGKGVIYRMIDEQNNDCPYDFKNIMFTLQASEDDPIIVGFDEDDADNKITKPITLYTFSWIVSDTDTLESLEDAKFIDYSCNNRYIQNNTIESNVTGDLQNSIVGRQLCQNVFLCYVALENKIYGGSYNNFIVSDAFCSTFKYAINNIFVAVDFLDINMLYSSYIGTSSGIIYNSTSIRLEECSDIILHEGADSIKLKNCNKFNLGLNCENITKTNETYLSYFIFEGNNRDINITSSSELDNITIKLGTQHFVIAENQDSDAPLTIAQKSNGDIIYYREVDLVETDSSGVKISGADSITTTGQVTYTIDRNSIVQLLNTPTWRATIDTSNGLAATWDFNNYSETFNINVTTLPTSDSTITITATIGSVTLTKEVTVKVTT